MDSKILRSIEILVVAVAALILTRLSISYIIVLALIGLITTIISKRRKDGIIAGILYTIIGYVISYPAGMFFAQFTPETPIPVTLTITDTIINQATGLAIPIIISIIITTIVSSAIIFILNLTGNSRKQQKTQKQNEAYFQKPPKQLPQNEVYFNQQPQQPQDEYIQPQQPQEEIPPQPDEIIEDELTAQIPIQPQKQPKQTTNNKKRKSKSRKTKKEKQAIIYHDPITNYKKSKKGE